MKLNQVRRDTPGSEVLAALIKKIACGEAVQWCLDEVLEKPRGSVNAEALWLACQQPDWMLWLVASIGNCPETLTAMDADVFEHNFTPDQIRHVYESPWLP